MSKRPYPAMPLLLAGLALATDLPAAVTDVRSLPRQATVVASGANVVNVGWRVATTPDHASGVVSSGGLILDPATGRVLQRIVTPLAATGGGALVLREALRLDAATVSSWADQGLRRVVLQRAFVDPATGASISGEVVLAIARSPLAAARGAAPGDLNVVSLQVEFDTGSNAAIVDAGTSVRAALTVQYSGTGILRGRWQVAEPGAADGVAIYRTLSVVNANLQTSQRSRLASPVLPNARPGTYLLRFCVDEPPDAEALDDVQCPDASVVATAVYQVHEAAVLARIDGVAPDRTTVSATTRFSWQPLPSAALYRLQIFEYEPTRADAEAGAASAADPRFVTGMLLDEAGTALSELVLSRLEAGRRYLWRVTAYDDAGRAVGSSAEASFVYGPE